MDASINATILRGCAASKRIFDLALLARPIASGIGRPFGLLRWTWLTKPFLSMNSPTLVFLSKHSRIFYGAKRV